MYRSTATAALSHSMHLSENMHKNRCKHAMILSVRDECNMENPLHEGNKHGHVGVSRLAENVEIQQQHRRINNTPV